MILPELARTMVRTIMLAGLLALWPAVVPAGDAGPPPREAAARFAEGERQAAAGRHFLAAREYRQAIARGFGGCEVHWKLSLALYGLGLVDDAIEEIGKARRLCPDAGNLRLPSGILHLARGELEPAAQHFVAALRINPGSADAYYYLGEVCYRQGDFQRAWLCCLMARKLGHPGDDLGDRLAAVAAAPQLTPWRDEPGVLHLRLIQVPSRDEAQRLLERLAAGELFEQLAVEQAPQLAPGSGGYAGVVAPADLEPAIAAALLDREAFHPPLVLEVAGGFQILQRIAPFDAAYWDGLLAPAPGPARGGAAPAGRAAADPARYRIYAGSYGSEANARKRLAVLERHGFAAYLFRQETPAGKSHHVIAGKYATRKEAAADAARLEALGIDHYIGGGN